MLHFSQKKKQKQFHFLEELKLGFNNLGLGFTEYQNLQTVSFGGVDAQRCS